VGKEYWEVAIMGEMEKTEYRSIQKATLLTTIFLRGNGLKAREIAKMFDVSTQAANYILAEMSEVIPLFNDNGIWRIGRDDDE
jgi:hypothetical protein